MTVEVAKQVEYVLTGESYALAITKQSEFAMMAYPFIDIAKQVEYGVLNDPAIQVAKQVVYGLLATPVLSRRTSSGAWIVPRTLRIG
jgi:hypothetical protein